MIKTNQFQVTSKEALQSLASQYSLEVITKEENNKTAYSLYSSSEFEGDIGKLCQELQKLLSNEQLVFLSIGDSTIAITPDKITIKPATSITASILLDMLDS